MVRGPTLVQQIGRGGARLTEEARALGGGGACRLLERAEAERDYLHAAYVLVLVLGLRKGEVLGHT
ncbi:hypothetical protein [Streptomyces sp. MP131-18]|uniref:hypothetical protein n=1 Tax=Streptomyces sp. MP131-18 TaxID=1857892 RepID=UPI0009C7449D|nr:hypothetical protein [Streptomyces sp. MP131-18]ONK13031.1 hypothetical protein STBA_37910 [Streptomyces sp. MP131-18]